RLGSQAALQLDADESLLRGRRKHSCSLRKSLYGLTPLSLPRFRDSDFQGPVAREVDWWPDEKGEALSRTRVLDLLVELERLARKVSADVEEYPVVVMKSLERSGAGEVRDRGSTSMPWLRKTLTRTSRVGWLLSMSRTFLPSRTEWRPRSGDGRYIWHRQ